MPCYPLTIDGRPAGFICTARGSSRRVPCRWCASDRVSLCDGPARPGLKRKSCSAQLCNTHRTQVGPDVDLCPDCLPLLPQLVVTGALMADHPEAVQDILLETRLRDLGRELERAEAAAQTGPVVHRERAEGRVEGLRRALELLGMPELVGARAPALGNPPAPQLPGSPQIATTPGSQASALVTTPAAAPAIDPPDMGRCSSCKAPIRWVVTEAGKAMPVDYEPKADGNLVLSKSQDGKQLISKAFDPTKHNDGRRRWVSHFATCKFAGTHRKVSP